MSVALDRYLKAGDLYTAYDPITSTERFFKGTADSTLVFIPPARDPPKVYATLPYEVTVRVLKIG